MSCSEYDAERLRQELARDERVSELGIEVKVSEDKAFLRGRVTTDERRQAVARVAERVLEGCTIVNEVKVTEMDKPKLEHLE